jgi:predicted membrane protein
MAYILFRMVLLAVLILWPIWIAIVMMWTGHMVLFKKRSKTESTEASSTDEQPVRT